MIKRIVISLIMSIAILVEAGSLAHAQRISFIRDTEVENTIRAYATPLFEAAGLNPSGIEIHIVNDKSLNAFVAGGLKLFINTGLLLKAEHPGQVIGVIAHETGHISGGHLSRSQDAFKNASNQAIVAMVLGAAAALASGRADVGLGVSAGGNELAMRNLLAFTRAQETSADQAGVNFLDRTGQSAKGLLEFMEILSGQELLVIERQDPYVRTHPLTMDRIEFLKEHVSKSRYSSVPIRPEYAEMHRRMRAKLFAFTEPPARTLARYKADDKSLEARMARAIAYYRKPDLTNALPLIDKLIEERPQDPYLYEIKGQILFENARAQEALLAYRESARLMPNAPLILVSLAQVELEVNDDSLLPQAQAHLNQSLRAEPDNAFAWRQLAIAYGRSGNDGMTSYAMAEHALLNGNVSEALYHAERADKLLPKGSPAWMTVQDIKSAAERARQQRNK